jgi:hypothetical protein
MDERSGRNPNRTRLPPRVQIPCRTRPNRTSVFCYRIAQDELERLVANVIVSQLSVNGEVTAAGVIGGRGEMSYFIVCPQQVGQLVAVKHNMSDGRTSIDLAHCVQIRVPLSMSVSRPLLIVDAPVLHFWTTFNYVTRLTTRSADTAILYHLRSHDWLILSMPPRNLHEPKLVCKHTTRDLSLRA